MIYPSVFLPTIASYERMIAPRMFRLSLAPWGKGASPFSACQSRLLYHNTINLRKGCVPGAEGEMIAAEDHPIGGGLDQPVGVNNLWSHFDTVISFRRQKKTNKVADEFATAFRAL